MANVTIFNSPQFGDIRTAGTSEQPLFCLADVCKALELQPSRVKDRLECGVISTHPIVDSLGREQMEGIRHCTFKVPNRHRFLDKRNIDMYSVKKS